MNVQSSLAGLMVEEADLSDLNAAAAIDAFVADHEAATLFHRAGWSRAVERGCRQRARYLVARSSGGRIVGLLPLTEIRSILFGNALVSTGFGVDGGIIASTPAAEEVLVQAAEALANRLGLATIELRGGMAPRGWTKVSGRHAGFSKPLPSDAEEVLGTIPRKQRAEVRKALSSGLSMAVARDDAALATFYDVYAESVRNLGTPVFPRPLFTAMRDEFGSECDILTVRQGSVALASVMTFYFKGTAMPFWGGGRLAARSTRANEALYYALMRHAVGRGCTRFDFGRSKVGTGAYAHKKNWGFEPQPLSYAVRTLSGEAPREINPLDPRYAARIRLWQRLPLWASKIVGPPIARGLG